MGRTIAATTAIYGVVFLGFVLAKADYSRAITLGIFTSALVLVPAPYFVGTAALHQALGLGGLLAAAAAGSFALRATPETALHTNSSIKTELYNLEVHTYSNAFPKSAVRGGALARIGDRYLVVSGDGHLHVFSWEAVDHVTVSTLPYRVPINGEAFSAAAGRPWAHYFHANAPQEGQRRQAGHEILNAEWFRAYGLLVQEVGAVARIFVSHPYWHATEECWTERVSVLESDRAAILRGEASSEWKTLYETTPCLPVRGEHRRRGIPFVGYFGGGRMALLGTDTLLLTVGDFGFDGLASVHAYPQDPSVSYGKTIAINIRDGSAAIFTAGHRNPQGLYVDPFGTIWSTEHGPQGGDELNRLVRGANYGWPYATYGTDYGSFSWPLNKPEAEQKGYEAPVFAWVPSIAVSNLVGVERGAFSQWQGDLLIATLKAATLFRARVRDGQVKYLEAVPIGIGIRDIIEGHDGSLLLWTDDQLLISLRPRESSTGEALFAEKCSSCHQSKLISGNRIGPDLLGIVGRRVASVESYPDYSSSLRRIGGIWTEERLDEFLRTPSNFCPGTMMDFVGAASATERRAIISYLRTL
ncbi:PQQ-dependent sugar dehydrogenase [Bradyrhizobium sp. 38]|uniref:PQQ-dependent sugar dehydrogenase n=1 Tax=unclassified Bradyrhizobium TaxID=2631580 RepID=UPI001FFC1442|nr:MULTISPECIES: PQQ-dependent sugar dehydrogenase [unclassified Bradyrhizobium]MCK1341515.1 PQQ-dependent sugar dehydrogenase [Bradyrhizobium sp. 38]MCK1776575.1 PQQ-dependent sugar dehydrogenase [Bradyrhizobium sp. 132]